MRKSYLLGAFAILLTAIGSPAPAQETGGGPIGPGSRYGLQPSYDQGYYDQGYRGRAYDRRYYYGPDGFNPVGAAGEVVGGAAQTAGAIATAPFQAFGNGSDSYAMSPESSYCAQRYRSYDPASGTFMGYDGRRHPCP